MVGATAFSVMTLSITAWSIMTLRITIRSITIQIMILVITPVSTTRLALSVVELSVTFLVLC